MHCMTVNKVIQFYFWCYVIERMFLSDIKCIWAHIIPWSELNAKMSALEHLSWPNFTKMSQRLTATIELWAKQHLKAKMFPCLIWKIQKGSTCTFFVTLNTQLCTFTDMMYVHTMYIFNVYFYLTSSRPNYD